MSEGKCEAERKTEVRAVVSFLVILGIIGVTVLGLFLLIINRRVAKEDEKQRIVPAVEVMEVFIEDHPVKINTQGVVESVRETMLAAEVGGRVMMISDSLRRGGKVEKDDLLVQIDPADYRSALAASEVRLAEAELALQQEMAKVEQAQLDWSKLGNGKPLNPLVLREPYLAAAKAKVESAQQDALKARRDLDRTEIHAPFDAGVRAVNVEVGSVASPSMMVAELYSNDELEVRLPLSLEDFGFVARDEKGNVRGEVKLTGKIGTQSYVWLAEPVRVDPEIDRKTLSASVVVKVLVADRTEFPLPPVGLFVKVEMEGEMLEDIAEIPRRALMEGGRVIVMGDDGKIDFREVELVRMTEKTAVVHGGLEGGEKIVLTRLSAPVVGMEVAPEPAEEEK
ncbi:MAG: efflux RND transporter periplasmic adaptor subunit [Akkermansiaceae bacterium]|jgi:RND family efflux transporter MFP subunit|nr:efflux RND transporter periplasmic adaptor subunit [Akkermansiaceae bacterium]MDP4646143.1 efflux RND transporter periplasmic adaptor subunit [Akkermansiaceae bacterium]MDP4720942.1 efflux RND transporter periplasmic adaptor subunit [Akkermansiaceae bacterium]MDP4780699.1 efflux RND transporter periplasmic adaptor subunit [Akkermansiaceae bacterium]MDP4845645.1 efflux RND transporter periplasmic adaptor subunit [Akkermansiaceae bacterium]